MCCGLVLQFIPTPLIVRSIKVTALCRNSQSKWNTYYNNRIEWKPNHFRLHSDNRQIEFYRMRTNWFSFVEWSSSDSIVGKMASIILFIMLGSNWIPVSSLIKWFSFIFYSLGDCVVCCCGAICIFRSIANINMGKTFLYCIKKIKFFSLAVCRRSYSEMQKRQHQQRQRERQGVTIWGGCVRYAWQSPPTNLNTQAGLVAFHAMQSLLSVSRAMTHHIRA